MTFAGVAILAAAAVTGLSIGLPRDANTGLVPTTLQQRMSVIRQPLVLPALLVTTLWGIGGYTDYTYIAPFLRTAKGLEGVNIGFALFLWGRISRPTHRRLRQ
jgi:predicted MFS family arabinose efflux permease